MTFGTKSSFLESLLFTSTTCLDSRADGMVETWCMRSDGPLPPCQCLRLDS